MFENRHPLGAHDVLDGCASAFMCLGLSNGHSTLEHHADRDVREQSQGVVGTGSKTLSCAWSLGTRSLSLRTIATFEHPSG